MTMGMLLVEEGAETILAAAACKVEKPTSLAIVRSDMETIRIQLEAQGLITVESAMSVNNTQHVYWTLTDAGKATMMTLRAIKWLPDLGSNQGPAD